MRRMQTDQGSVAVLFAVVLTVLVGFAAISVDVGRIYLSRLRLHNIADFAALAGAQKLPGEPDAARQQALAYIERNGVDPSLARVTVSADQTQIAVRIERAERLHFARVLGFGSAAVGGEATVRVAPIAGSTGAVPIGVPEAPYTVGELVALKLDAHSRSEGSPGNFQALALGHNGASTYEYNLRNGYSGLISVGEWLTTETGNMAGPTRRAIQARIDADPDATWDRVARGSSRVVLVPILTPFPNGRGEVQVKAFATFFIEDVEQSGSAAAIYGRFIHYTWDGETDPTVPNYGTVGVKLVG